MVFLGGINIFVWICSFYTHTDKHKYKYAKLNNFYYTLFYIIHVSFFAYLPVCFNTDLNGNDGHSIKKQHFLAVC